jgi:hypothetical protein
MDFADVRRLFPGATERVFLDAAAISITSTRAVEAVARFVELVTRDPRAAHHGTDAAGDPVELLLEEELHAWTFRGLPARRGRRSGVRAGARSVTGSPPARGAGPTSRGAAPWLPVGGPRGHYGAGGACPAAGAARLTSSVGGPGRPRA